MTKMEHVDRICRTAGARWPGMGIAIDVRCVHALTVWAVITLLLAVPLRFCLADDASVELDQVVQKSVGPKGARERLILKFTVAEEIAKEFYSCAEREGDSRSIHIVDQYENTVYAGRMDGQIADNIDVARLKALSALYFRESTAPWLQRSRDDQLMAMWIAQRGQFVAPVGLPIIVDNQLLGAVGIGGASGDCVRDALAIVLGRQSSPDPAG